MANDLIVYETRGLRFTRQPETLEEMNGIMVGLQYFSENLPWTVGDAINYGQDKFGEEFNQLIPERSAKTYMNYCWVSRRIPYDERVWDLSWSHYSEAAALVREARAAVLKECQQNEWTVVHLREVIRGKAQPRGKLVTCPGCGAELEYKSGSVSLRGENDGQNRPDSSIRENVSGAQ